MSGLWVGAALTDPQEVHGEGPSQPTLQMGKLRLGGVVGFSDRLRPCWVSLEGTLGLLESTP